MCGICGIINYTSDTNLSEDSVRRMCEKMRHRGPDDEGIYTRSGHPGVFLGQRRLSIIDLSPAGHQPMSNEDGSLWMTLNGEIYNYHNLRSRLQQKGHQFRSNTDAEVVLHLYEEYAEDCLLYLRGMFALAIWDERQKKLFLARDRVGKKPLLYYYDGRYFCFASEFSALLTSGLISKELNYEAIDQYLTFGYVPAPQTIYKNVFKIEPAHYAVLQNHKLKFMRYWELDYSQKIAVSEEDAAAELMRRLKEAVKLRLASDVPLGVFLSGGIDSSTIVGLMRELTSNKVKTFSIGFEDTDYNELKYARNIARLFSTDHHEFIVKPKALEILPVLIERFGEPYADSSAIPSYYVSRETKRYVTVALNGDGGDESFAGYERYQAMKLAQAFNRLPRFFREPLRRGIVCSFSDAIDFKSTKRRIRRFFENVSLPFSLRYTRWVSMMADSEKDKLYSKDFKNRLGKGHPADWLKHCANCFNKPELTDLLMGIDIKTNLPNDLLVKMDIATSANSLEARSPFLDQELMQFAAGLPVNFKLKRLIKKYILKKGIKGLLPADNIHRRKMGFGVPVGKWMRNELKGFTESILLSKRALGRGYFNPEGLKEYVTHHTEGKKDYGSGVWALLMLELWHQHFID